MPTDEDQATGLEKKEHDALMAGVEVSIVVGHGISAYGPRLPFTR